MAFGVTAAVAGCLLVALIVQQQSFLAGEAVAPAQPAKEAVSQSGDDHDPKGLA